MIKKIIFLTSVIIAGFISSLEAAEHPRLRPVLLEANVPGPNGVALALVEADAKNKLGLPVWQSPLGESLSTREEGRMFIEDMVVAAEFGLLELVIKPDGTPGFRTKSMKDAKSFASAPVWGLQIAMAGDDVAKAQPVRALTEARQELYSKQTQLNLCLSRQSQPIFEPVVKSASQTYEGILRAYRQAINEVQRRLERKCDFAQG